VNALDCYLTLKHPTFRSGHIISQEEEEEEEDQEEYEREREREREKEN
jgi:hypothetical protein